MFFTVFHFNKYFRRLVAHIWNYGTKKFLLCNARRPPRVPPRPWPLLIKMDPPHPPGFFRQGMKRGPPHHVAQCWEEPMAAWGIPIYNSPLRGRQAVREVIPLTSPVAHPPTKRAVWLAGIPLWLHYAVTAIHRKESTIAVFFDVVRVFDHVWHPDLLH